MDRIDVVRTLAVACGGAAGSVGRYWISGWAARLKPASVFPWGTLTVNLIGALVLGAVMAATTSGRISMSPATRVFLAVGVLGGFTTFSTFSYETVEALRLRDWNMGLGNVLVSVVFGIIATWMGIVIGHRL